jgi:hypothetical protein
MPQVRLRQVSIGSAMGQTMEQAKKNRLIEKKRANCSAVSGYGKLDRRIENRKPFPASTFPLGVK